MTEYYDFLSIPQTGSISVSTGTTQPQDNTTILPLIEISEIEVNGKKIRFSKPLKFTFNYDEQGFFNVDDDRISIHESDADFRELVNKVKEDLEIQWEDIVMAEDRDLYHDAIELKRYLQSFK